MKLVVLPGLDGTADLDQGFCRDLRLRGVDATALAYPLDSSLGYRQLEAWARARLPDEPFVLLGESFSGPLALRIAATPPPLLKGMVLSTTFAHAPLGGLSKLSPFTRLTPTRLPPSWVSWVLLAGVAAPSLEGQLEQVLARLPPAVLRKRARETLEVDARDCLPKIKLPSLYLKASKERLLNARSEKQLIEGIGEMEVAHLMGSHLLLQTNTRGCADRVARFVHNLPR